MKTRSTKKALLASLLSLVVCVSMLVGSTFAWFTDSVTSAQNVIQSGNLDVELYYTYDAAVAADADSTAWKPVTSSTDIYGYDLWEPGYTKVAYFKVENEGSLALKYTLSADVYNETAGVNQAGETFLLSDYLKTSLVDVGVTRDDVLALAGTPLKDSFAMSGEEHLTAGDSKVVGMAIWMPTTVGNVANHNGTDVPAIEFGINLFATQDTVEADSFDKFYDKDAYLPVVYNIDEFKAALADGKSVRLGADIASEDGFVIDGDKDVTIDLGGKTITVNNGASTNNRSFKIVGDAELTVKNGTLVAKGELTSGAYGTIRTEGNAKVTLDNVKLYSYRGYGLNVKAMGNSKIYINDSEIYAQYSGGVEAAGGYIELNNTKIVQEGVYSSAAWCSVAIGVNGDGKVVVNSGEYSAKTIATDANAAQGTWVAYVMSSGGTLEINGGTFNGAVANTASAANACGIICADRAAVVEINGGTFNSNGAILDMRNNVGTQPNPTATLKGGTFSADPTVSGLYSSNLIKIADGHVLIDNGDGTWTVEREYINVVPAGDDKDVNGAALADAITTTTEASFIKLPEGEYKMPNIGGNKEVTIVGTKDTVIDLTAGAYMDGSKVAFEGVTIKGSTGMSGSDYAAMYTPDVTYVNCTFVGAFRIGRDGATFINCTFTNLGNDYVWNMNNDTVFEGCTFNTDGKALLLYADGPSPDGVATVVVKNCKFNATKGAKAGAIANQNCAAIEIQNYGCSIELISEGNTHDSNFSGMWRIKTYDNRGYTVTVNGTEYTSIAVDGKTMTIDADKNVTVNG